METTDSKRYYWILRYGIIAHGFADQKEVDELLSRANKYGKQIRVQVHSENGEVSNVHVLLSDLHDTYHDAVQARLDQVGAEIESFTRTLNRLHEQRKALEAQLLEEDR